MDMPSVLGDDATLRSLGAILSLTLFYAALAWLPLRGTAALVQFLRSSEDRKASRGGKAVRSPNLVR